MSLRQLSLFFVLLTACPSVFASNARGYVRAQCPMTGDSHLHLTHVDGRKLNRDLYLPIPEERVWMLFHEWYDSPGETCPSRECEPSVRSKVQILRVSRNPFPFFHHAG
jgi:hypothetical protein